jgi:catechol 2,3-dioxygenase-like lactoylglutathione lyase family enzyme
MTLKDSNVATRLPAQDLDRARAFYAEKVGLEPVDERPGGLLYRRAWRLVSRQRGQPPRARAARPLIAPSSFVDRWIARLRAPS